MSIRRPYSREQRDQFLRLLNDLEATFRTAYGDARAAAIVRTVWLGQQAARPYDITSLAAELNFPRQTISYCVRSLIDDGVLEGVRSGHSTLLRVKEPGIVCHEQDPLGRFMEKAAEILGNGALESRAGASD